MASEYTLSEIRSRLEGGEDGITDFKEVRLGASGVLAPNSDGIAELVVAFANADGGTLFFGVDDQGIVRGIPDASLDMVEQWIINLCSDRCHPPIRPRVLKKKVPTQGGSEVFLLIVDVPKGIFVHKAGTGRYLVRVGSTKRELTADELGRLFQARGRLVIFDEQGVPGVLPEALDSGLLASYFGRQARPENDLLRKSRILVPDEGGILRPSVAGLLAFSQAPTDGLPNAFISAAVYRGTARDSNERVHAEEIDGPVAGQIETARDFVNRHMLRPATRQIGREDEPQYDLGVVHEAIVNAVAHRDYSVAGAKIRLSLLADRLELSSPGRLPNTLTIEELPHRQFTRNQLLVRFLARLRDKAGKAFIEAQGEGVQKILAVGKAWSGRSPEYRLFGDELLLTIWARRSPHATDLI